MINPFILKNIARKPPSRTFLIIQKIVGRYENIETGYQQEVERVERIYLSGRLAFLPGYSGYAVDVIAEALDAGKKFIEKVKNL